MLAIVLAVIGLLIGPLLGIAIDRVVDNDPFEPEHRCPTCAAGLGRASLAPVRSWFVRCPTDRDHPRWRYPLADLSTAALFAFAGWRFGLMWQLWPYLALFAVLVVMAVIDWEHHLLVNDLTLPTIGVGLFAVLVLSGMNDFTDAIWPAVASAGFYMGFLLLAHLVNPAGLGLGDVKLAPTLGLFLGWLTIDIFDGLRLVMYAMIVGMLLAAVVGLVMRFRAKKLPPEAVADQPEDWIPGEVPLGPFLIIGAVIVIGLTTPAALG